MVRALDGLALKAYCRRLGYSNETFDVLVGIRESPPARRVRASAGNVPITFPSSKMGFMIQAESHTVEFARLLEHEKDPGTLEYYDQPPSIRLTYTIGNHERTVSHTADYFVFHEDWAGWEECKPLNKLLKLAQTQPNRYVLDAETGQWRCPPGEAYAKQFGLRYVVWVAEDINWNLQENWIYLEPYYQDIKELDVSPEVLNILYSLVEETLGISLSDVQDRFKDTYVAQEGISLQIGWHADQINRALALGLLYVDLARHRLSDKDIRVVPVYRDQRTALAAQVLPEPEDDLCAEANPITLEAETGVTFDGKTWQIKLVGKTEILLLGEDGTTCSLPHKVFEKYVKEAKITGVAYQERSDFTAEGEERLDRAGPVATARALERDKILFPENYPPDEDPKYGGKRRPPSKRTIRRWKQQFHLAEVTCGSGWIGLLPDYQDCGRKGVTEDDKKLITQAIVENYDTVKRAPRRGAYGAYLRLCDKEKRNPVPPATFYDHMQRHLTKYEQVLVREGPRAAYPFKDYYRPKERTRAPHGQTAWEHAYIDHKLVDLVLRTSERGSDVVLGKCWMTMLVLDHSRRLAAYALSFDPPSYRSCLMVLRLCVKRHAHLPESITVDGGKEFQSIYFDKFLAVYRIRKRRRPASEPRFGSVQERLGLTMDTEFIDHLLGNTQATRDPRTLTKDTDPYKLSVWNLPLLAQRVRKWADEIYDNREHPALHGLSPRQAFEQSIERDGARLHKDLSYNSAFMRRTMPTTRSRKAKIEPGSGVRIMYVDYWCEQMHTHIGEVVPVRYDPFNRRVATAYVGGQWRECTSAETALEGCTEREVQLIAEQIRQHNRLLHGRKHVEITQKDLAAFRQENGEIEEDILDQRWKDRENKKAYAILEGGGPATPTVEHPSPPTPIEKETQKTSPSPHTDTPEAPDRGKLLVFKRSR